jgi:hypothetical protein
MVGGLSALAHSGLKSDIAPCPFRAKTCREEMQQNPGDA